MRTAIEKKTDRVYDELHWHWLQVDRAARGFEPLAPRTFSPRVLDRENVQLAYARAERNARVQVLPKPAAEWRHLRRLCAEALMEKEAA